MRLESDLARSENSWRVRASIDRLTIVGDYPTELFERHYYDWQRDNPFVRESGHGLKVVDTTKYVNSGADVPEEQVAYIEVPKFQADKIRLDFNPNHGLDTPGGGWLLELIASIENKHYSRCDIAFDIFNNPRAKEYRVWAFGTTQSIFLGPKREMQTTYYGSPKSGKQIRQYNKLVEQKAKGKVYADLDSWWRVELQLRSGKVDDYPVLVRQMLEDFYVPNYAQISDIKLKSMIYWLSNDPASWGELGDSTRFKYHKIFREMPHENELALSMADEFVRSFDRLENELHTIMNRFDIDAEEI